MSELQTEIPFVIINLLQVVDGWIYGETGCAQVWRSEEGWEVFFIEFGTFFMSFLLYILLKL